MKELCICAIIFFSFQIGNAQNDFVAFPPLPAISDNFKNIPRFNSYRMLLEMIGDKEFTYQVLNKEGMVLSQEKFCRMVLIETYRFCEEIGSIRIPEINWELKVDRSKIIFCHSITMHSPYSKIMYRR